MHISHVFVQLFCFTYVFSCAPPMNSEAFNLLSPLPSSSSSSSRLHGDLTHTGNIIQLDKSPGFVTSNIELFCYNFDSTCTWSNMAGLFVDELDWMQGNSGLDPNQIFQITQTTELPDQNYAIVATDKAESPDTKAVLVSKIIECQTGQAELRFKYWTSPGVRIVACTKSVEKAYPNYDYCSQNIEIGDPGPAYISIPDLDGIPFQIYIRAENFAFHSGNLQGGFAILDDIEYYGDFCTGKNYPFLTNSNIGNPLSIAPALPFLNEQNDHAPSSALNKLMKISVKSSFSRRQNLNDSSLCSVLNCTFDRGECLNYLKDSNWLLSNRSVGNPLTGIRGDSSLLPYNQKGGMFAYVTGPISSAQFKTKNFTLETNVFFMFSYHKVAKNAELILKSKKSNELQEDAPKLTIQSRRWFRETRELISGDYDYLMFEAKNISANEYIGIDELIVLNAQHLPLCSK